MYGWWWPGTNPNGGGCGAPLKNGAGSSMGLISGGGLNGGVPSWWKKWGGGAGECRKKPGPGSGSGGELRGNKST